MYESNGSKDSETKTALATTKMMQAHMAAAPMLTAFLRTRLGYVEIILQEQVRNGTPISHLDPHLDLCSSCVKAVHHKESVFTSNPHMG